MGSFPKKWSDNATALKVWELDHVIRSWNGTSYCSGGEERIEIDLGKILDFFEKNSDSVRPRNIDGNYLSYGPEHRNLAKAKAVKAFYWNLYCLVNRKHGRDFISGDHPHYKTDKKTAQLCHEALILYFKEDSFSKDQIRNQMNFWNTF